jgi:AcrR family transcriptional regulator
VVESKLDPEREEAILTATLDVLAETGYEALRMDAVAARAKASKATLYRHWPGKPDLVVSAFKCYKQDELAHPDTGSLRGDILATLFGMRDLMTGPAGQMMTGVMVAMQKDEELARTVRESMLEDKDGTIRQMVDRAVGRGELPPDTDPALFPDIAPAMLFMRIFVNAQPADDDYLVRITDEILIPLMVRSPGGAQDAPAESSTA